MTIYNKFINNNTKGLCLQDIAHTGGWNQIRKLKKEDININWFNKHFIRTWMFINLLNKRLEIVIHLGWSYWLVDSKGSITRVRNDRSRVILVSIIINLKSMYICMHVLMLNLLCAFDIFWLEILLNVSLVIRYSWRGGWSLDHILYIWIIFGFTCQ